MAVWNYRYGYLQEICFQVDFPAAMLNLLQILSDAFMRLGSKSFLTASRWRKCWISVLKVPSKSFCLILRNCVFWHLSPLETGHFSVHKEPWQSSPEWINNCRWRAIKDTKPLNWGGESCVKSQWNLKIGKTQPKNLRAVSRTPMGPGNRRKYIRKPPQIFIWNLKITH